jgi:hypothetical protein
MGSVASKIGNVAKGAIGGLITGGPAGALSGGLGGLFSGGGGDTLPGSPAVPYGVMGAADQAPGGGGGFWNWVKNNGTTLGNLGIAGAALAGGGNPLSGLSSIFGKLMNPQQLNDPRQQATNDFGGMLSGAMKGQDMAGFLQNIMGPAYSGQLNAGANAGQTASLGDANSALASFFAGDQGQSSMNNMNRIAGGGYNVPPEIAALLGQGDANGQLGSQIQQLIGGATGNQAIGNLLNMNNSGPGVAELSQLFNSGQAGQLLNGGVGQDLNSIGAAIGQAQQPQLDRTLRDLREQFSFNGLGQSTDLNSAAGTAAAQSQASLQGILAQIAPQLAQNQNQTSLGALQALSGIGGQMGNINTGSQQAAGQLINQANLGGASALSQLMGQGSQNAGVLASLFNNQMSNQTQAALAQPGAFSQIAGLGQLLAGQNFNMNSQMQQQDQGDLTRQYQAWQNQQQLAPNILQMLSGTGQQQYQQSILQQLAPIMMAGYGMKQAK